MTRKPVVNTMRSLPTRQDALCLALMYAHQFCIKDCDLERAPYALNRCTLNKIGKGNGRVRNREKFLHTIILALNDKRLRSRDECVRQSINMTLRNICLVMAGISHEI